MAHAIIKDSHQIMPASVYLQGEYGLRDICFGVPVVLGRNGVERILELDLNDEEKVALSRSAELIRGTMASLPQTA
jgi:malate dehydrogenase